MAFGAKGSPAERPDRGTGTSSWGGKPSEGRQAEPSEPPEVAAALRRLRERQDPSFFEPIYRRYFPSLRSYFLKRRFREPEAEELAQEVLSRAWENFDQYRGDGSFSAWLGRIAANQWKNAVRERQAQKRQVEKEQLSASVQESEAQPLFSEPDPPADVVLARSQTRQRLRDAMRELPERMRACVGLRVARDFTYKEIAEALGVTVGTVQSQIHDGKKRLRDRLGPDVDELDF